MGEKSRGPEKFASSKDDILSKYPKGKIDFIIDSNSHLKIEEIDGILTYLIDKFGYWRADIFEDINKFLYANRDFDLKQLYELALADPVFFNKMPKEKTAQPSDYVVEKLNPEYAHSELQKKDKSFVASDVYASLSATSPSATPTEKLEESLPRVRYDISRLMKYYKIFEENSGEYYKEFLSKHPEFAKNLDQILQIAETLSSENKELSNEEIADKITQYNKYVSKINSVLNFSKKEAKSREQKILENIASGKIEFSKEDLTEEEEKALMEFANALREEMFPASYIDRAVMSVTGQEKLDDYQKYLLAVGNGVELVLTQTVKLADPETYKSIVLEYNPVSVAYRTFSSAYDALSIVATMSEEDWNALYKSCEFMAKQLDTHSTVAGAISFIVAVSFLKGGFGHLSKNISKKMPAHNKIVTEIINKAYIPLGSNVASRTPEVVRMVAPLAIMWGITLPYIKM